MQWQLGILGTISAFAYRHRETKKNLCRGGWSQDLPNTDLQPAVRRLKASSPVSTCYIICRNVTGVWGIGFEYQQRFRFSSTQCAYRLQVPPSPLSSLYCRLSFFFLRLKRPEQGAGNCVPGGVYAPRHQYLWCASQLSAGDILIYLLSAMIRCEMEYACFVSQFPANRLSFFVVFYVYGSVHR